MKASLKTSVRLEVEELRQRLQEAEETLNAIRSGEVDALVVTGPSGEKVFTLEGAEHPYRVLVESMNEGALTLSLDGTILYCNAAFARLAERPLHQVMGRDAREFVASEERDALELLIRKANRESVRAEIPILTASGQKLPTQISLNPINAEEEPSIGVIITDVRVHQRNERAEAAVRIRDDVLAIASHELREPLGALVLNLQVLERVLERDAANINLKEIQKSLRRAQGQAIRIGPLLDRLLDFSQMASGKLELDLAACDLGEIVKGIAERFSEEASGSGCDLRLTLSRGVTGRWDKLRLEQVATNIIANAIKFGAGHPVEIQLKTEGRKAVLVVQDRGIGVSPHDLDRIFGRFERTASSKRFSGLGLGLYIAREIIEAHGGTITAENRAHGGARFVVYLPLT
jgi:PAS domain S-box-containing protein